MRVGVFCVFISYRHWRIDVQSSMLLFTFPSRLGLFWCLLSCQWSLCHFLFDKFKLVLFKLLVTLKPWFIMIRSSWTAKIPRSIKRIDRVGRSRRRSHLRWISAGSGSSVRRGIIERRRHRKNVSLDLITFRVLFFCCLIVILDRQGTIWIHSIFLIDIILHAYISFTFI